MTGRHTHEQNQRIINRQENTKGADVPMPGESLEEARSRRSQPPAVNDMSRGDRSIKRGANQEGEHHKRRVDDD